MKFPWLEDRKSEGMGGTWEGEGSGRGQTEDCVGGLGKASEPDVDQLQDFPQGLL